MKKNLLKNNKGSSSLEIVIVMSMVLMLVTFVFSGLFSHSNTSTDKLTQSSTIAENKGAVPVTQQVIVKETPVIQQVVVKEPIKQDVNNDYSTKDIVNVKNPSSFLDVLGINIIAEIIGAILIAGVSWLIKDYLKLRKKHKLNMRKEKEHPERCSFYITFNINLK